MYWDRAWSLIGGCSKASPGCDNCWAEKESNMRANNPNEKVRSRHEGLTTDGKWNGSIKLHTDNIDLPLRVKKPTVWAIWNDLFHEDVPDEFIARAWWVMGQCAGYLDPSRYRPHKFIVLTKRAERMKKWIQGWCDPRIRKQWIESLGEVYDWMNGPKYWPDALDNVLLGVTAENQEQVDKRIPILLQIPAAVRFVSVEPMLGPMDFSFDVGTGEGHRDSFFNHGLNWVICGGESGSGARPIHPEWARSLRDQCTAADVSFFFKQWGEWVGNYPGDNWDPTEIMQHYYFANGSPCKVWRCGKKKAGRTLDGYEWNDIPEGLE